jgi:hypothetical protein
MKPMCNCTNCDCKECGSQNFDRLTGAKAVAAGVQPWEAEWYCDPACGCCAK